MHNTNISSKQSCFVFVRIELKTTALLIWILFLDWKCIFSIVLSCCCCGCSAESRGCFPQGKASPGFGSHCTIGSSPIWRSNFIFILHESNTTLTTTRHAGNFQNLVGASLCFHPDWKRVNVSAKTWWGLAQVLICPHMCRCDNLLFLMYNRWIHQRCCQSKEIWHNFWWQHRRKVQDSTSYLRVFDRNVLVKIALSKNFMLSYLEIDN